MSKHEQSDKALNDYLEGCSEISGCYRSVNKAEPASLLDEKILSAAKQAVSGTESNRSNSKFKFSHSSWAKSLSVAAVITLSISLIITMQQQTDQSLLNEPKSLNDSLISPATTSKTQDVSINAVGARQEQIQRSEIELEVREHSTKTFIEKKKLKKKIEYSVIAEEPLYAAPAKADMNDSALMEGVIEKSEQEKLLLEIKSFLAQGQVIKAKEKLKQFRKNYATYSEEAIREIIGEKLDSLLNSE